MSTTNPTPRTAGETLETRLREPMRLKGCTCLERIAPCPYCDESLPQYEREREEAADALARLERENARLAEWHAALMPHLERLLTENAEAFGIDGDGESCWPILAEFVTRGRALTDTEADDGE